MSDPTPDLPPSPPAEMPLEATVAPEPSPPASGVPSTPYRPPPTPPAAAALAPYVPLAPLPGIIPSSLFVYGASLWAFCVMGVLATTYTPEHRGFLVGEGFAVLCVLGAAGLSWSIVLRRTAAVSSRASAVARSLVVGVFAVLLGFFTVAVATGLGKSGPHDHDDTVTLVLTGWGVAMTLLGRRRARLEGPPRSEQTTFILRILWAGAGLLTFVALGYALG